jgi:plastocyanin
VEQRDRDPELLLARIFHRTQLSTLRRSSIVRTRLAQLGMAATLLAGAAIAAPNGLRPEIAAAQPDGTTEVAIIADDYHYDPPDLVVNANEPIQFVMPNIGADRHRLNFQMEGSDERVRSDDTGGGGVVVVTHTFTVPGVYQMWCSATTDGVSHRDLGMVGTLTVLP